MLVWCSNSPQTGLKVLGFFIGIFIWPVSSLFGLFHLYLACFIFIYLFFFVFKTFQVHELEARLHRNHLIVSVKGSVIICGLTCWFSVVLVYDVSSVEFCDIIFLIFLMHACQWYECLMHCVQLY